MEEKQLYNYDLNFIKTIDYFLDVINGENQLSRDVLKEVNFSKGEFHTLIPSSLNLDCLYNFKYGWTVPKRNFDTKRELISWIKSYLEESSKHFMYADDVSFNKTSKIIQIPNIKLNIVNDEVYYLANYRNTFEEIFSVISNCENIWHMLLILGDGLEVEKFPTGNSTSQIVTKNIRYIITTAYDGESYLIWKRTMP